MGYDSKIHKKTNKDYEPIHILNYIFQEEIMHNSY